MTKKLLLLLPAVAMMTACSENSIMYKRLEAIATQDFDEINKIDAERKNNSGIESCGDQYKEPIGGPADWARRDGWQ